MHRELLVASLILCLVGTHAGASGRQARGWYVQMPLPPGAIGEKVDDAYRTLGPFRSKDSCETARLNLSAAHALCYRYHHGIIEIDRPVMPEIDYPS